MALSALLGGSSLTSRLCANIPFDEADATCHTHREQAWWNAVILGLRMDDRLSGNYYSINR